MALRSESARRTASQPQSNPTLRVLLDQRAAEGRRMTLEETIAGIVSVCMDLQDRHTKRERRPGGGRPGPPRLASGRRADAGLGSPLSRARAPAEPRSGRRLRERLL